MRLKKIDQATGEKPMPDVRRVLNYRPTMFGQPFSDTLHELLHGPSEWSIGERELFAAFVSSKNQCAY